MKATKRLLAWLLAIAMIVGTVQTNAVTAYADTTDPTSVVTDVTGTGTSTDNGATSTDQNGGVGDKTSNGDNPSGGDIVISTDTTGGASGDQGGSTGSNDANTNNVSNDATDTSNDANGNDGVATKPTNDGIVYDAGNGIDDEYGVDVQAVQAEYDLKDWIDAAGLYKGTNSNDKTNPVPQKDFELTYGDPVFLALEFHVPNSVLSELKTAENRTSVKFKYTIPSTLTFDKEISQPLEWNGTQIGTYTIQNNEFSFTFNDAFFDLNMNEFKGWANFFAKLNESHGVKKNEENYSWSFTGKINYEGKVKPNTDNYKLEISKSVDNNTSSLTDREFKLTVKSTGTNKNVVVTDTLGQYLTLASTGGVSGFTVVKKDGTTKTETTLTSTDGVSVTGPTDGKYTISLPDMEDGDQYTITYKVNVDETVLNSSTDNYTSLEGKNTDGATVTQKGLNNNARVSYKKDGTTDGSDETNKGVKITKTWLGKNGSYDESTHRITWTVTLNADGVKTDLSGKTIKDTFDTTKMTYVPGSITLDSTLAGLNVTDWEKLFTEGVTLPAESNLTGTYKITYQTELTEAEIEKIKTTQQTYSNKAQISPDGTNWIGQDAWVPAGTNYEYITKTCNTENGSSTTVSWTVTVNVPDGFEVTDATRNMTDTLPLGMTLKADTVKVNGETATSVTTEEATEWQGPKFTIPLDIATGDGDEADKAAGAQTFVITFDSEITDETKESFTNTATFYNRNAYATYTYKKVNEAPTANKSVEDHGSKTGVIVWKVSVKDSSMITARSTDLKLVDTIPSGLAYADGSATLHYFENGWKEEAVSGTVAGGKLTLTFTEAQIARIAAQSDGNWDVPYVTYKTKVTNLASLTYGQTYRYTNKAHWELGTNIGDEVSADAWYKDETKVLDKKKGESLGAGRYSFTIVVNENELTINGGKDISLTDTMGTGLDYVMGSMKVSYIDNNGNAVEEQEWSGADKVSYNSDTHTLTIMGLKDAKKYTITYNVRSNLTAGTSFTEENGGNTVTLTGSSSKSMTDSTKLSGKATAANAGGTIVGKSLRIYKYGDGDGSNALKGANFTIYEVNYEKGSGTISTDTKDRTVYKEFATLSDGYATVTGMRSDTLYLMVETQAPTGYVISDDYKAGVYFAFMGDQTESTTYNWPKNVTVYNADQAMPNININNDSESDTAVKVRFAKKDSTSAMLAGAQLQLINADTQNEVTTWTSGTSAMEISLEPGNYTLKETKAPSGYEKAADINFTVKEDGTVTTTSTIENTVTSETTGEGETAVTIYTVNMTDEAEKANVEISKVDVAGAEIEGAQIEIKRQVAATGEGAEPTWESVTSWTSGDDGKNADGTIKTHTVTLAAGTYKLTETTAPKGYAVATEITFTVENDEATGKAIVEVNGQDANGKITMTDDYAAHDVYISKKAVSGVDELAGATLSIKDAQGNPVEIDADGNTSWTSGTEAKNIKLQPGTYTLIEDQAPTSYDIAEAITFTVDKNGKVTSDNVVETTENGVTKYTVVMRDKTTTPDTYEVKIAKQNEDKEQIEGAELVVLDGNGNQVDSWTTKTGVVHTVKVAPGTYTLHENKAPEGYQLAADITFVVSATGEVTSTPTNAVSSTGTDPKVYTVTMTDAYKGTDLTISKRDIAGEELKGAKLDLYTTYDAKTPANNVKAKDIDGKEITSWNSDGINKWTVTVKPGTYTLVETSAPNGYEVSENITFTLAADGKITLVSGGKVDDYGNLVMTDNYSSHAVKISKRVVNGTEELAGAELTITDEDGKTVESWTSGKNAQGQTTTDAHEVSLQPGTYTLTEMTAPDGYQKAESITFMVDVDGEVILVSGGKLESKVEGQTTAYTVVMEDKEKTPDKKEVKISKRTITEGVTGKVSEELPGAKLTVKNSYGEVVTEFTSGTEPTSIYVVPGTYTLTETTAPEGYEIAEDIEFTVDQKGNITSPKKDKDGEETGETNLDAGKLVMVDQPKTKSIAFSKEDVGGKEIPGATLTLTAKDNKDALGNTYNGVTWTSGTVHHKETLNPGTYTLTEALDGVPAGYVRADSITFTINKDGTLTIDKEYLNEKGEIVMVDEYQPVNVKIVKQDDKATPEKVIGASLAITGTKLGDTKPMEDIVWQTDGTNDKAVTLQPGSYTLSETKNPFGYEQAKPISIEVAANGEVTIDGTAATAGEGGVYTVTMTDKIKTKPYTVKISKKNLAGEEILGAKMSITGKEVKSYGADITDNEKAIDAIEWTSTGKEPYEVSLAAGEYYLTETTAPKGYKEAEQIKFEIKKTDDNGGYKVTTYVQNESDEWVESKNYTGGQLVMVDDYAEHDVVISKQDLIGAEIEGATLTLTGTVKGSGDKVELSWVSGQDEDGHRTTEPHTVQLKPGKYTLTEKLEDVPDGYLQASSIDFTIDEYGNIECESYKNGEIVMTDKWDDKEVTISKKEITGKEEIEGAVLTISGTTKDKKDVTPIQFTSTKDSETTFKLQPGNYTLTETTAPKGYAVAESVKFEVTTDGKVKVNRKTLDGTTVTMLDDYAERTIKISKRDIANDEEIDGAVLTIFKGTGTNGEVIEEAWTSVAGKPHEVSYKWDPNETYTLTEVSAPSGYKVTTSISFRVDLDGNVTLTEKSQEITIDSESKDKAAKAEGSLLVLYNKAQPSTPGGGGGDDGGHDDPTPKPTTKVGLSVALVKTDSTTGLALAGATFELYKNDGTKVGTYTTDEYGIIRVDGLNQGDYYFKEVAAPDGYIVSSWQQVVRLDQSNTTKNPEIVAAPNTPENPVTPTEGIGSDDENGMMAGDESGAISATGDSSMMTTYGIMAGLAAAALAIWYVYRRKRQHI